MIKEIKKIANNQIDYKNLEENHLSIQLSLDGFSFCIYNKVQQEIAVFCDYEFENESQSPFQLLDLIKELYGKEDLLKHKYKSVSISHFNNLVSQVPQPFFDKNELSNYLNYSIKVLENDFITFDNLKSSEIVNVYIPFVNINNFLLDFYGSFEFKHSSTILIEQLLSEFKNAEGDYCFVNVSKSNFELVVVKNKKLELFNCFSFKTKEDFIYYILFTAEQLKLNPEELQLILLGDIEKESELFQILYQYVRNISFYSPKKFPEFITNQVSEHSNFILLNQY